MQQKDAIFLAAIEAQEKFGDFSSEDVLAAMYKATYLLSILTLLI